MFESHKCPLVQIQKTCILCNEVSNWWLNKLDASESKDSLLYCIRPIKRPGHWEIKKGDSYYVFLICILEEIWGIGSVHITK